MLQAEGAPGRRRVATGGGGRRPAAAQLVFRQAKCSSKAGMPPVVRQKSTMRSRQARLGTTAMSQCKGLGCGSGPRME